jgi:excisionase family DNA binding protein
MTLQNQQRRFLTRKEAAEFLGVKEQTLNTWKWAGRHNLPCIKVGRSIRYDINDLEKWLQSRKVNALSN